MSAISSLVPELSPQLRARMTVIGAAIRLELEQLLKTAIAAGHAFKQTMKSVSHGVLWFIEVVGMDFVQWRGMVEEYLESAPRRELHVLAMRKVTDVLVANRADGEVVEALGDYLLKLARIMKAMASEGDEARQA